MSQWRRGGAMGLIVGVLAGILVVLSAPTAAQAATSAYVNTGGGPVNIRSSPSTIARLVTTIPNGRGLSLYCQVYGQQIKGAARNSPYWLRMAPGRYIADAYVRWKPRRPSVPWCGPTAPVVPIARTTGGPLNVRSTASSVGAKVGTVPNGSQLIVLCQVWGQRVTGTVRRTAAWNRLGNGRLVSDAFVTWSQFPTLPWCGQYPPTIPAVGTAAFIARVAGPARAGQRQYRVPASVTIAQAIIESGWGRSGLTRRDHNYFGIKCFGSPGTIAVGCRSYATHECNKKRGCYRTHAQFRAYRNATGSMADHGRFLTVNPRYRNAFKFSGAPERFAKEIHKAGYATSPRYATNVINIMRRHNLYRFNR